MIYKMFGDFYANTGWTSKSKNPKPKTFLVSGVSDRGVSTCTDECSGKKISDINDLCVSKIKSFLQAVTYYRQKPGSFSVLVYKTLLSVSNSESCNFIIFSFLMTIIMSINTKAYSIPQWGVENLSLHSSYKYYMKWLIILP